MLHNKIDMFNCRNNKRHDSPKTPYQRIIESPHVSEYLKASISKQLDNLNPFLLRKTMEKKLKTIFSYINPG
jgi:hypothetical protein